MTTKISTFARILLGTCLSVLLCSNMALAANLPFSDPSVQVFKENEIPGPYTAEDLNGVELAYELVFVNLLRYAKIIIGVVGILFIVIMGYRMATAQDEEESKKKIKGVIFAIVGLVVISASQDIAKIFDMGNSTLLQNPGEILKRVGIFNTQVEIIITFIKYIIGGFAAAMIVRSGLQMVVKGEDEENVKKQKKNIIYSGVALLMVLVGNNFINKVFYRIDDSNYTSGEGLELSVSPLAGVKEIIGITNFMVTIIGPLAIAMLIFASVMYLTANGEQDKMDKAKRILVAVGIGIIIIYGAFAIVSTMIV